MIFSRSLAVGDKREMGLYEEPCWGSLFGLGIGIIFANFRFGE